MKQSGFSLVELLVIVAIVGLLAALFVPGLARSRDGVNSASCQNNLKQLGIVFELYASENRGLYPRMQGDQAFGAAVHARGCALGSLQDSSVFGPQMTALLGEYLYDAGLLLCPADRRLSEDNPLLVVADDGSGQCQFTGYVTRADRSYQYLGFMLDRVDDEHGCTGGYGPAPAQLVDLLGAISPVLHNMDPGDDGALDKDIVFDTSGQASETAGNAGSNRVFRLRSGIARFTVTDINFRQAAANVQFTLPVMWDRLHRSTGGNVEFNHEASGSNVLYLDGHVDFTRYAGQFPATASFTRLAGL